jgi:hypothetical protein
VSELRSVVEAFRCEALADLPDARLEEDFAELQRAVELLEAERLRRLAEIDRRGLHERDGFLSAASWLASSHRVAWGNARAELRIARALRDMPRSLRALQEGKVSMSAIKVLAAARQTDPSAFDRSEPQLLEAARVHVIGDLQRVVGFWRQQVDNAHDLRGDDAARARRRLHASATYSSIGRMADRPRSGTSSCCAVGIIGWCMRTAGSGWSCSTAARRSRDRMDRCWRTECLRDAGRALPGDLCAHREIFEHATGLQAHPAGCARRHQIIMGDDDQRDPVDRP